MVTWRLGHRCLPVLFLLPLNMLLIAVSVVIQAYDLRLLLDLRHVSRTLIVFGKVHSRGQDARRLRGHESRPGGEGQDAVRPDGQKASRSGGAVRGHEASRRLGYTHTHTGEHDRC